MLNATHGNNQYTEKVTGYDKNGNILGLQRYGQTGASSYGLVDNLTYTYNGNKLTRVDDAVTATSYTGGTNFINGANTNNEYTYDQNGNLTKDSNKGIANITYNLLSLPQVVTFSDGSTIRYMYSADGTKLRTTHVINGVTTTTDYCGNVIYENGTAKRLLHDEGYFDLTTNTYYYYLKDHQGNNRVVINSSGTVQETNHYYPFGGLFAANGSVQPYKYNGKEFDTKKGLNLYDYGARHYDAALGRWHVVDPLAEKMGAWSPYGYCKNSPLIFIDPNGKREWPVNEKYNGYSRKHENNYGAPRNPNRFHKGVDINYDGARNEDLGAPILATHDGKISKVVRIGNGDKDAGGNRITITSSDGTVSTSYMHLDAVGDGLEEGMAISEGQQIGTMGGSGKGSSSKYTSHLHYEIKVNGENIDPTNGSNGLIDPQNLITPMDGGELPEIEVLGVKLEPLKPNGILY